MIEVTFAQWFFLNLLIPMLQFEKWGFKFTVGRWWRFQNSKSEFSKFWVRRKKWKESVVDCHLHLKPGSTMVNSRTTFTCFGLFRRVGKPEKPNRQARRSAASTILSYWADRAIRLCFDPEVNHLFHFCFWYIFSKGKQGNVEKYDLPFICISITSIWNQSLVLNFIYR